MATVQDEVQTLMTRQAQQGGGLGNRTTRVLERHLNEPSLMSTQGFTE